MYIEMELESEQDTGLTDDQWLESQAQISRACCVRTPSAPAAIATPEGSD
jgi:hypothetical protein